MSIYNKHVKIIVKYEYIFEQSLDASNKYKILMRS